MLIAGGVAAAALLMGLGASLAIRHAQGPAQADREAWIDARKLNADAAQLLLRHEPAAAAEKLKPLLAFLSAHPPQDPEDKRFADEVVAEARQIDSDLAASAAIAPTASPTTATPGPARVGPANAVGAGPTSAPMNTTVPADAGRAVATALSPVANSALPAPIGATTAAAQTLPATVQADSPSTQPASRCSWTPSVVPLARPPTQEISVAGAELSDELIGRSIEKGVTYLLSAFDPKATQLAPGTPNRLMNGRDSGAMQSGADALAVYALMQCGQATGDARVDLKSPFMTAAIDAMKSLPMDNRYATYARGIRATALALNHRGEDLDALKQDVDALLKSQDHGRYGYGQYEREWDNSNSQYGLLGVWSGAEAGVEVPLSYWQEVGKHWVACQHPDGQWGYRQGGEPGKSTMTCAGLASMFVCHDYLDGPAFGDAVGREPFSPALEKGMKWLETGNNALDHVARRGQGFSNGYALYGVERVGLASGFKYFGKHDWYPELARLVIAGQSRDGSWPTHGFESGYMTAVETSYALLFLSRGRHPILMNKLRFNGFWANRPRDAANLAKYASIRLERPLNWQVVPLTNPWTDWADAPILYLASHKPPSVTDEQVSNIRQFVEAGGLLFVQADGDAKPMSVFAQNLAHRLFPRYEMRDVPASHPLFASDYKLNDKPTLQMVSNDSRILMLFSPKDLSKRWQLHEEAGMAGKPVFQLGVNLFVYAAGPRDFHNRLQTNYIEPVTTRPKLTIKIARVSYAGAWNPEPYAWERYARWFRLQTDYALDVRAIAMKDLSASEYAFAHLTGTARYTPTNEEIAAVKKYVEQGGVLLCDVTGGSGPFINESIRGGLVPLAFANAAPRHLPSDHPLLIAGLPGMTDVSQPRYRPYNRQKLGAIATPIDFYAVGKGHIILADADITSGLLNASAWGILGFDPTYSQQFVKNAILWTMDGQMDGK